MLGRSGKPLLALAKQFAKPHTTTLALRRLQHTKPPANLLEVGTHHTVMLPATNLNSGFKATHEKVIRLQDQALMSALISPTISVGWMFFTQQMLLESPIAVTSLVVGAMVIAERMAQRWRLRNYTRISLLSGHTEPSASREENLKMRQLVAGEEFKLSFLSEGIETSGVAGKLGQTSAQARQALEYIQSMGRVVLPSVVLRPKSLNMVDLVHDRWLSRLTVPLSIMNMILIAMKDPKDRRIDDYVVLASSTYNLFDYFSGPSVHEARQRFATALLTCKTPEAVARLLLDNKSIDEGSMAFLKVWLQDQVQIGVRVDRMGSPILYKDKQTSFGGPYPIELFPKQKDKERRPLLSPPRKTL